MGIYYPDNPSRNLLLASWADKRIDGGIDLRAPVYAIGVERQGSIVAVAVFHSWRGRNAEISFASDYPLWATRQAISAILSYGFDHLTVKRLTAICRRKHKKVRKLLEGIGFVREGSLRDAYTNDNAVIYGMTLRDYLKGPWHGQESTVTARSA